MECTCNTRPRSAGQPTTVRASDSHCAAERGAPATGPRILQGVLSGVDWIVNRAAMLSNSTAESGEWGPLSTSDVGRRSTSGVTPDSCSELRAEPQGHGPARQHGDVVRLAGLAVEQVV